MSETFEDYMSLLPGYAKCGVSKSMLRQFWDHQQAKIDKLEKQLKKCEEVLKWYANPDHYDLCHGDKDRVLYGDLDSSHVGHDLDCRAGGKRARQYFKNKGSESF